MAFQNAVNANNNDFQNTSGVFEFADRTRMTPGYVENLGMTYTSSTLSITATGGAALSTTNPGYVVMSSKTPGLMIKIKITANQGFIDDTGASEIINNTFGTTAGTAWANGFPFYVYAVTNDAENVVAFMIHRRPHTTTSPAVASIGAPDDAVANTELSFWSMENIDETLYDENPCLCIGNFNMTKTNLDDWTVTTLDNGTGGAGFDGIGNFNDRTQYTMPLAQNGASTGTYFTPNGGTAPIFTTNQYVYYISKDGWCTCYFNIRGDGGTDGAGVVIARLTLPIKSRTMTLSTSNVGISTLSYAAGALALHYMLSADNQNYVQFITSTGNSVNNATFSNGNRDVIGYYRYPISIA